MRVLGLAIWPFIADFTLRNTLAARGSGRIFDARWFGSPLFAERKVDAGSGQGADERSAPNSAQNARLVRLSDRA